MTTLNDSVRYASGVGPKLAEKLGKLGIETVSDLLRYYPRRYLDRSNIVPLNRLKLGAEVTVVGTVVRSEKKFTPRQHKKLLTVDITDGTGYLSAVWFNNWWHADKMKAGAEVAFSGKAAFSYGKLQMTNPVYDILDEPEEGKARNTGTIIPLYPASADIPSSVIRRIIGGLLNGLEPLEDPVPTEILRERGLIGRDEAIRTIHAPVSQDGLLAARRRLIYDELFVLELGLAARRARTSAAEKGFTHDTSGALVDAFYAALPFRLTESQDKVIAEIFADMAAPSPMHRLLQGEVGSGKTVVAVAALAAAVNGGYQGAIMAPTEVLAEQHAIKIGSLLPPGVKSVSLSGSMSPAERKEALAAIQGGEADVIIGTHAVIQEGVEFKNLGLAVVDEQHRFGVRQRMELKRKGGAPDVLVMTATPIPRTLALTLYGDLDVSVLDELPAGRREIETIVADQKHRTEAYELIRQQVAMGRQAYVVCALVDESDSADLKAATAEALRLESEVFPELRVGVVHGRMKAADKEAVMSAWRGGSIDILIATTVIEVGIDVSNASVMLIENAERFGLSQLHQLRGRIGRGEHKSFCVLFSDPSTEEAKERVKAFESTCDGFALAEADLKIRGEGQIFGARQSGLPELRIASIVRDFEVLRRAREDAFGLIAKDPDLRGHKLLAAEVRERFKDNIEWLESG